MNKKDIKRETNFELLRIVAMIMIVSLHYWGKSEFLDLATPETPGFFVAWFIRCASFCAVNCYVLISGYHYVESKFKISKVLSFWEQVTFYSILIYLLACSLRIDVFSIRGLIKAFLPISMEAYWFATVYFLFLFICPFLKLVVEKFDKNQLKMLCITLVTIFSVIPTVLCLTDYTGVNDGYSVYWFVTLFFSGAYIRKNGLQILDNRLNSFLVYILAVIFVFIVKIGLYFTTSMVLGSVKYTNLLFRYNSVPILVASIGLFMLFKNIRINNGGLNSFILKVSPLTFGIYLIHLHPSIKDWFWSDVVNPMRINSTGFLVLHYLIVVFSVFFICAFIEKIRILIMQNKKATKALAFIDEKLCALTVRIFHI